MTRSHRLLLSILFAVCLLASNVPAAAQDEPTIAKDFVELDTVRVTSYRGNSATWSWKPKISFRVNGPISSGSQLYVEFGPPGLKPVLSFNCDTGEIAKGYWWNVNDCRLISDEKSLILSGLVEFKIRIKNELHGTNATLFTGKAKVGKFLDGSKPGEQTYYVDHDWSLPIGYLYFQREHSERVPPVLGTALAFRGYPTGATAHLFFQGKEVSNGNLGRPEVEIDSSPKHRWVRLNSLFMRNVLQSEPPKGYFPENARIHVLAQNPGNYEVKVLSAGKLIRIMKFTVAADGTLDNGVASANKLGSDRIIVPVQVLATHDGVWDRLAWKAGAFYGNPLTGFTSAQ